MGQLSPVLRQHSHGYIHWCPACCEAHIFYVHFANPDNGARWTFDGNVVMPSFSPSMNISWVDPEDELPLERCHYFIKAGKIEYCSDSTHALAGTTVDLPSLPEHLQDPL